VVCKKKSVFKIYVPSFLSSFYQTLIKHQLFVIVILAEISIIYLPIEMGSGASKTKPIKPKQENLQQPLSTQNKTNISRPNASSPRLLANTSRKPLTPIQTPIKQDRRQSINKSQASIETSVTLLVPTPSSQVQNRSPSVPNEATGTRKIKVLSNGPPASCMSI